MRLYEPIWNKLKSMQLSEASTKGVSVTANRVLHPRIIKAVKKEKWLDAGYKIKLEPREAVLFHSQRGVILTFYLKLTDKSLDHRSL
jgi:hypothetical protein